MFELICTLRASQLFLHQAHLLAKGVVFMQDHEMLGDMYSALESDFDALSEELIGLGGENQLKLQAVMVKVVEKLSNVPSVGVKENKEFFKTQLEFEKSICSQVEQLCKTELGQGTKQLLGDIAKTSNSRQYKIKRRIG